MESSLTPKLEILNSLSLTLHNQPHQLLSVLPRNTSFEPIQFPLSYLTDASFLVLTFTSLSPLVSLPIASPPPQTIPCPGPRVIFLKQGTNPEWQRTGVVNSVEVRSWVESWFHHLLAMSSWECNLSCLCLTLLRS